MPYYPPRGNPRQPCQAPPAERHPRRTPQPAERGLLNMTNTILVLITINTILVLLVLSTINTILVLYTINTLLLVIIRLNTINTILVLMYTVYD